MSTTARTLPPAVPSVNECGLGLLRQPRSVLFGPGQRRQAPQVVASLGGHAAIVTDARMATTGHFAELIDGLTAAGLAVSVFAEAEPELPYENVVAAVRRLAGQAVDVLVGIGGGSCMDLAKVVSVLLANQGDVRDYYGEFLVPGPGLPVVTIPTTAGTGAEVTCISVIFDRDKGMKVGVASPYLEAAAAIVDPELTLSCPPGLTAATGADALTHLIESFTGRAKNPTPAEIATKLYVGKNLLADVYARSGLAVARTSLEAVAASPADLSARSDTMFAAYCAGMAINTAGTAGAHAIQSPIGNITHTSHGFGVGALLPYVMRYNLPARVGEFAEVGRLLGACEAGQPELDQAKAGIERVDAILAALSVPADLKALGLAASDFGHVADRSLLATRLIDNNPRTLDREGIVRILERGYAGDRSWDLA